MTKLKWRVEFELEVDESLVGRGFDLTQERAALMLLSMTERASSWWDTDRGIEVNNVKITESPSLEAILDAQWKAAK